MPRPGHLPGPATRWCRALGILMVVLAAGPAVAAPGPGSGPPQEPREPRETVWVAADTLNAVQVRLPVPLEPGRRYPLVVGLHGHGGRADEFFTPADRFAAAGVIYAVAQGPYAFPSAGRIGYSWNLRGPYDDAGDQGQEELTIAFILEVVDRLQESYPVDETYLMGFSQGGGFTYRTALRNPGRFAGLAAFGSGFDPDWFTDDELEAAAALRVFVGHGRSDAVVPRSTRARDVLAERGFDVVLFDYEGGHTIAMEAIDELLAWVVAPRSR